MQPWSTLLPDLIAAAAEESPVAPAAKQRALTTLKHVLQALRGAFKAAGAVGGGGAGMAVAALAF